jgi:hypothetical protein
MCLYSLTHYDLCTHDVSTFAAYCLSAFSPDGVARCCIKPVGYSAKHRVDSLCPACSQRCAAAASAASPYYRLPPRSDDVVVMPASAAAAPLARTTRRSLSPTSEPRSALSSASSSDTAGWIERRRLEDRGREWARGMYESRMPVTRRRRRHEWHGRDGGDAIWASAESLGTYGTATPARRSRDDVSMGLVTGICGFDRPWDAYEEARARDGGWWLGGGSFRQRSDGEPSLASLTPSDESLDWKVMRARDALL